MKYFLLLLYVLCLFSLTQAQVPVTLGLPPDARSTGMGDVGLATTPDAVSQHWNVSKYAFATTAGGYAFSYTPWMRSITDGMALLYLSGYAVIDAQAISASLRYFSIGELTIDNTLVQGTYTPKDYAFDLGYSRRFSEYFSMGMAFRYISTARQERDNFVITSVGAFAADVGAYFRLPSAPDHWTFGLTFTNIGTKLDMGGQQHVFLPMNLGLGAQYATRFPQNDALCIALDINKSLIPQAEPDAGVVGGIFSSFGNSLNELTFSTGIEYGYDEKLFFRGGYFYNNPHTGARSHATLGVGVCFYDINIDCSYLIATGNNVALKNTLRFTIGYTFNKMK